MSNNMITFVYLYIRFLLFLISETGTTRSQTQPNSTTPRNSPRVTSLLIESHPMQFGASAYSMTGIYIALLEMMEH